MSAAAEKRKLNAPISVQAAFIHPEIFKELKKISF